MCAINKKDNHIKPFRDRFGILIKIRFLTRYVKENVEERRWTTDKDRSQFKHLALSEFEFKNRPVVVTNCTDASLYVIPLAAARLGTVRRPVGVFRDLTDMKHIFTCNNVYVKINTRHHVSKETSCQKEKTKPDSGCCFFPNSFFLNLHTQLSMQQLRPLVRCI